MQIRSILSHTSVVHMRTLLRAFLDTCRAVQLLHACLVKFKLSGTVVASVACRMGSQEFHSKIVSLPLVSLHFIVIPTPFLNFYLYLVYH